MARLIILGLTCREPYQPHKDEIFLRTTYNVIRDRREERLTDDTDITEIVLNDNKFTFLLIAYDLNKSSIKNMDGAEL